MSWLQGVFDRHPWWLLVVEHVWWICLAWLVALLLIQTLLT